MAATHDDRVPINEPAAPMPQGPRLRVLFVASEVAPFRKTGGLADVIGALPKALARRGIDVRVVMPLYRGVAWNDQERLDGTLSVSMYYGRGRAAVRLGKLPGSEVPVYFIEHHGYYDRPHLYGPPGDAYSDNLERFVFFCKAALELCKAIGFIPDVVHAHDWQAALVPVYINTLEWGGPLHGSASVFTIHNMAYQGVHESGAMFITGLGREHYNSGEFEHFGDMNLMKAALAHSTLLSTVSPTYCREIQTSAFGYGLDGELARRHNDLRGILNGIDTTDWDPASDRRLPARYDSNDLSGKLECKLALQRELGLEVDPKIALCGIVGRMTHQKGYDVFAQCLPELLGWNAQFALLGTGDRDAEEFFAAMSHAHGQRFRAVIGFDDA